MSISREQLEQQIVQLELQRNEVVTTLHATDGAIQVCQYLLSTIVDDESNAEQDKSE